MKGVLYLCLTERVFLSLHIKGKQWFFLESFYIFEKWTFIFVHFLNIQNSLEMALLKESFLLTTEILSSRSKPKLSY